LSTEELQVWVREAPDRDAYQKRLSVWLTYIGPYHAHQVAEMLGVSRQAVWLWIGQYNRHGPSALERPGRGGRRWSFLTWKEEEDLLKPYRQKAAQGELVTAVAMWPEISKAVGRKVSLAYVYRLLHRHGWRKLGPRPRHVKSDPSRQEEFKKKALQKNLWVNSGSGSWPSP
jgi:transposase